MRRRVIQLVDATTAAGAAYDSGILDLETFSEVTIHVFAAGAGSGAYALYQIKESGLGQAILTGNFTINTEFWLMLGRGGSFYASGSSSFYPLPGPPRRIQLTIAANPGATLYVTIDGTKFEDN